LKREESNYSTYQYLTDYLNGLKPSLAFKAADKGEWEAWRKNLKTKLVELLGGFPVEKCPLNAEVLETVEEKGYVREKVVYDSEVGASVPAYALIPKGRTGRLKALLCLHGHGRGKDDVAGIAADDVQRQQYIRPLNYDYAVQFVKRGYFVLAPDARCFGERLKDGMGCTWAFTSGLLMGKVLVGMRVLDAIRSIDYMETRPEVDKERIGCVGLSWGGTHTAYTSAVDERVKAVVISGYFSSFKDMLVNRGCCPCQYVPNILKYTDFPDIVTLIAPRPLLIENGARDPLYTLEVVQREYEKVKAAYSLLDASGRVDIDVFDGAHMFSGRKAFDWFEKWL